MANVEFQESFEDFFEETRAAFVIVSSEGRIIRSNQRFGEWVGHPVDDLVEKPFNELLSIGSRILFETHLSPLLRMQGYFDEVALEMVCADNKRLPVYANATERRDKDGKPLFTRVSIFKGLDRHIYEQNLRDARTLAEHNLTNEQESSALREQFIAVLGHDLRNPLNAITMTARLMVMDNPNERTKEFSDMIKRSANRMEQLIADVMDLARGRLGSGISLAEQSVSLEPVLSHVVQELQTHFPHRLIQSEFRLNMDVTCDPGRLSQLLSNLVSNAVTHGHQSEPVQVFAIADHDNLEISVVNKGEPIPADMIDRLFLPFTRHEIRPSQQGLGLGLYIASEIAKAHGGTLVATSDADETRFTFKMPTARP